MLLVAALLSPVLLGGAPSFPDTALDFKVKNAGAERVYASLAAQIGKKVNAACVAGDRVTLDLPSAPVTVIFDVLAASLGVTYDEVGETIDVKCLPPGKLPPGTYLLGGAVLAPVSPAVREWFGVPGSVGMYVRAVAPYSEAAKSGLSAGDLVVDVDSEGIESAKDLDAVLARSKEPIQTAELRVIRNRETYRFAVVVRDNRTDPKILDRLTLDGMTRDKRESELEKMPTLVPSSTE